MTMTATLISQAAVIGDNAEVLRRIAEPDVHLALWQRALPDVLASLDALDWEQIEDIDVSVPVASFDAQVPELLTDAGYGDQGAALAREIATLGLRFAKIMGCEALRLRLEVIETDACRRFHSDHVTARLLMPLVGPGTQWIETGSEEPIHELRPGDVGVFKGRIWAEDPMILHRSPPIANTGQSRFLLAMNP